MQMEIITGIPQGMGHMMPGIHWLLPGMVRVGVGETVVQGGLEVEKVRNEVAIPLGIADDGLHPRGAPGPDAVRPDEPV